MRKVIKFTKDTSNLKFILKTRVNDFPNIKYINTFIEEVNKVIGLEKSKFLNDKSNIFCTILHYFLGTTSIIFAIWVVSFFTRFNLYFVLSSKYFVIVLILDIVGGLACLGCSVFFFVYIIDYNKKKHKENINKYKEDQAEFRLERLEDHLNRNYSTFMEVFSQNNIIFFWILNPNVDVKVSYSFKDGKNLKTVTRKSKLTGEIVFVQNPNGQDLEMAQKVREESSTRCKERNLEGNGAGQGFEGPKNGEESEISGSFQEENCDGQLPKPKPTIPMASPIDLEVQPHKMGLPIIEDRYLIAKPDKNDVKGRGNTEYPSCEE